MKYYCMMWGIGKPKNINIIEYIIDIRLLHKTDLKTMLNTAERYFWDHLKCYSAYEVDIAIVEDDGKAKSVLCVYNTNAWTSDFDALAVKQYVDLYSEHF